MQFNKAKTIVSLMVLAGVTMADDPVPPMVISENPMPPNVISENPGATDDQGMPDKLISGNEGSEEGKDEKFLSNDQKGSEESSLDAASSNFKAIAALYVSSVALTTALF